MARTIEELKLQEYNQKRDARAAFLQHAKDIHNAIITKHYLFGLVTKKKAPPHHTWELSRKRNEEINPWRGYNYYEYTCLGCGDSFAEKRYYEESLDI
jgi:hypothetical protein